MKKNSGQRGIKLRKKYRRIIIIILMVLLLISIGVLIKEIIKKEYIEESKTVYSFSNTPGISYDVYLKPNSLYSGNQLPENQGYFTKLIDNISIDFNNTYQGQKGATLQGDYQVWGEIIGLEEGTEQPTIAWQKQFTLAPKKVFETSESEKILSQSCKIDFNHYSDFANQVKELTGYISTNYLKIYMDINYTVTTKDGELTENLKPALVIPLGFDYFKISKEGAEEKKSQIVKTAQVPAPLNGSRLVSYSVISLLCIIALFILIFKSSEPTLADYKIKSMKKLLREHGKRLVSIETNLVEDTLTFCSVYSMEDMVKISDEIERPIFFVHEDNVCNIKEFFIIENHKAYIYRIAEEHKVDE